MTPLIVIPARQMSQGRPCKNREAWPALEQCTGHLGLGSVLVTDDPWLTQLAAGTGRMDVIWRHMNGTHTVAQAVQAAVQSQAAQDADHAFELAADGQAPVVVLQLSSPTRNRHYYVRAALETLRVRPDASSVVSVVPWTGEPPSKACTLNKQGELVIPSSPEPRQAHPQHYRRDGTVYAVRRQYAEQGDLYGPRPIPLLIDPKDSVTLD